MKATSRELDELIEEITVDADGDDEQLWAFREAFESEIRVPCDATVAGSPVRIRRFDYDGNPRVGLTAHCVAVDGRSYILGAHEVVVGEPSTTLYIAAYRKWLGLPATPAKGRSVTPRAAPTKNASATTFELIVISAETRTIFCRETGSGHAISLHGIKYPAVLPGEIILVRNDKQWARAGEIHTAGPVLSTRIDAAVMNLQPLALKSCGVWDPAHHFWGDRNEPMEPWTRPIIAWGKRPQYEMEQILPFADLDDPHSDPIIESQDLWHSGKPGAARRILMQMCRADLRSLDAHSHLGNMVFDRQPDVAVRHYKTGFLIGSLSLGENFEGLVPWLFIDNRPFLRCMFGLALCMWRLGRFEEAAGLFDRMLWLNPADNQGARFNIELVRKKKRWTPER